MRAALTGTPAQVARAAKKFRVYFSEVDTNEDDEDYLGSFGSAARSSAHCAQHSRSVCGAGTTLPTPAACPPAVRPPPHAVDHSIVMYLMGPDGEFIDFYSQLMSAPEIADKMGATIVRLEKEAGRGPKAWDLMSLLGLKS